MEARCREARQQGRKTRADRPGRGGNGGGDRLFRPLATQDALTGIGNWRHFEAVANREIGRARRSAKPLSAAYVDLDEFKKVNDSLGHRSGDALLFLVASVLQKSVRTFDCVARLGGDEFVVLMPDTELEGGRAVVERIRRLVEGALREGSWAVTLSVGLVTFLRVPASIDDIIKTADELMYRAKKSGKASVTELVVREGGFPPGPQAFIYR